MSSFAEISKENIVLRVIEIPDEQTERGQDYISIDLNQQGIWKQADIDGEIRKNYPSKGDIFDEKRNAFIAPEPEGNIGFDEDTCRWIMPKSDKDTI